MNGSRNRTAGRVVLIASALLARPTLAAATAPPSPIGVEVSASDTARYVLEAGETHTGDLYLMSGSVDIDGTLVGDIWVFAQSLNVRGTVTGDVNAWAQSISLEGTIEDSVRTFSQTLRVTGTIDGALSAVGAKIIIDESAVITGEVTAKGAQVEIHGALEQDLDAQGGQVILTGAVGGDAYLEADIVEIADEARIEGDLEYSARKRLDLDEFDLVGGDIQFIPEMPESPVSTGGVLTWFFCVLVALVTGLAVIALAPALTRDFVAKVGEDGLKSAGVGFITAIVVPVALLIVCVLIITIPLVLIAAVLFAILVYIAKVPVAIWAGDLVLRRAGRGDASPYLALTVGMPILYLLFAVPILGKIGWCACLFVGLGAMALTAHERRQGRPTPGSAAPPLPSASGAPASGAEGTQSSPGMAAPQR